MNDGRAQEGRPRDPDALLARADVRGGPRSDQHFLIDDRVLDRIPEYAHPLDSSKILEIGAGTGGLTDRLLHLAETVTAVERAPVLAEFLRDEFATEIGDGRLSVIEGDALTVDFPPWTACVSNLPYGAASELLFRLLPAGKPLVIMVQREFAERLAAEPDTPEYGRLSVTAGHYAATEILEIVPPEAFQPAPPVESAVVRLTPREPPYATPDDGFFQDFVTAVFTQRRKTMRNAIRNTVHISGLDNPEAMLEGADPSLLTARPGELAPTDFASLARIASRDGTEP